jgi:hypothetical protein
MSKLRFIVELRPFDSILRKFDHILVEINSNFTVLSIIKAKSRLRIRNNHSYLIQEEKERAVHDEDQPSYFWRAHTGTVLIVLLCVLVYTALIGRGWTSFV